MSDQILGEDRLWMTRDEFLRFIEDMLPHTSDRVIAFKVVARIHSSTGEEVGTRIEESIDWPKLHKEPVPPTTEAADVGGRVRNPFEVLAPHDYTEL